MHLNLYAKKEMKGAIANLSRQYTRIPYALRVAAMIYDRPYESYR